MSKSDLNIFLDNIVNCIDPLVAAIENKAEIDRDLCDLLDRFNGYSLTLEITNRGVDYVKDRLSVISKVLESKDVNGFIISGISRAQLIAPTKSINPFPIYLLYAGGVTSASIIDKGIALNLGNFVQPNLAETEIFAKLESLIAHETVHRFLKQMDIPRISGDTFKAGLFNIIWEEGLATIMETVHHPWHSEFVNDSDFWFGKILEWLESEDEIVKKRIFQECINRESCIRWITLTNGKTIREDLEDTENLDLRFFRLLTLANGVAYHLGYVLWKRVIDKGGNIEDLVKGGHAQVKNWLEEVK